MLRRLTERSTWGASPAPQLFRAAADWGLYGIVAA